MFNKVVKLFSLILILMLAIGCSSKAEDKKAQDNNKPVKIVFICTSKASPQILMENKYHFFGNQLKKLDRDLKIVSTRSLDNVWPMMDSKTDAADFLYLPVGNFATYITDTSRFGGSDKYAIIAGTVEDSDSIKLVTRPGINSLKDLAGKKIAIANNRYTDEFELNNMLKTVGLSTESMGGNVNIVYDDIVAKQVDNFAAGKYDGVVLYVANNVKDTLDKVPGSKVLASNKRDATYGKYKPYGWLVARKDLIKNNPKLVKEVLKAHLLANDKAITEKDNIPAIARETRLQWYKDNNAVMDQILPQNTLESFQKAWKTAEITYDPDVKYITDVFNFMSKKGLMKGKNIDYMMQLDLFKETLKEMGKAPIKE